jgi:hypothetical protein
MWNPYRIDPEASDREEQVWQAESHALVRRNEVNSDQLEPPITTRNAPRGAVANRPRIASRTVK